MLVEPTMVMVLRARIQPAVVVERVLLVAMRLLRLSPEMVGPAWLPLYLVLRSHIAAVAELALIVLAPQVLVALAAVETVVAKEWQEHQILGVAVEDLAMLIVEARADPGL
jgi:hypothetical protein